MDAGSVRQAFLNHLEENGHALIGGASLIPEHDPSVLFTTAGMHPLVPFLLGEPHPAGKRLANVQKCLRTDDIADVGDDVHLTFFEMLGYWSLGDYDKAEAIRLSFTFLTGRLGLARDRLVVTCFAGDEDAPRDEEAAGVWRSLGVRPARIAFLPKSENWWGPVGAGGPCGPDTEVFYDTQPGGPASETPVSHPNRFWELGNVVFMQYDLRSGGRYARLPWLNVDTGLGLERIAALLQGVPSPYETELFRPIVDELRSLAEDPRTVPTRVIADHVRGAVFILAEGLMPGNVDQPYIVRRLIRRAVRYGQEIGVAGRFIGRLAEKAIATLAGPYPELEERRVHILAALDEEESRFQRTLRRGRDEFERAVAALEGAREMPGSAAFRLYDTYGFPIEITQELAAQRGLSVDLAGFEEAFQEHQRKSRQGGAARFRGGLAEQQPETIRLHTATHLLHEALRRVLGPHVEQRGSNITVDRLRFDFSHGAGLTEQQIWAVERLVNEQIGRDLRVTWDEMTIEEAQATGATGAFDDRYGDVVKVYTIGDFSREICGGPHVERTGGLGHFRVVKERSVGAGTRRIRAVLEIPT